MKVAVLFSGGKDSVFAAWHCMKKGYSVEHLVTMEPARKDSYMFHYPNLQWAKLQAESMGIAHHMHRTSGEKEKELADMAAALRPLRKDVDAVAAGALASNYQADRVGRVCSGLGLKVIAPFWHVEIENYWKMILSAGFEVIITGVATDGLGKDWLGKAVDKKSLPKLKSLSGKHRFHLGGEGGEFETMVLDGPIFKKRLIPVKAEISWDTSTSSGFYNIKEMMSIDKAALSALKREYSRKKAAIKKRLTEFEATGKGASDERLFEELAFCICTPQSKAKSCWAAVESLSGRLVEADEAEVSKALHKGVRFHKNKARYIVEARRLFSRSGKLNMKDIFCGLGQKEARNFLAREVKGLGYKEASHFMRNIGRGQGIAILDRHILKNLKSLGVIGEIPKALTSKKYSEIEGRLSLFCAGIGIPEEELDLLLWSKETGEIFK